MTKSYDLILVGATGFTGRRAAAYLKANANTNLRWAMAARNEQKLHALATDLDLHTTDCFVVDTLNREQVDKITSQTKVILTTVGPFSIYGEALVASCAEHGTHYLDITGEVDFIRSMMDKYGDQAKQNQCKFIPFSGFDSVPADIAAYLLSQKLNHPKVLQIKSYYKAKGGFNGGTIATMMNKFESGEYKKMGNPRLIMEGQDQMLAKAKGARAFGFDSSIKRWATPFIMGAINSKVVYRSASLMRTYGMPYADEISYSEHSALGKWYNPLSFLFLSIVLINIQLLGPYAWFRRVLKAIAPNPGEGPSEKMIQEGFFSLRAIGSSENTEAIIKMSYPGDPGNKATVLFLCESALCLIEDEKNLPNGSQRFGFLTPMTAFGDRLIQRLIKKGLLIQ